MKTYLKKLFYVLICAAMIASFGAMRTQASPLAAPDYTTILVSQSTGSDVVGCGTGSAAPCKSIQYAVNRAASGDRILVAAGTYTYTGADPCTSLNTRSVVCFMDKQLTILGGYSTSNWTTADPVANLTIIDGGSQYRGVAIQHVSGVASLNMEGFTIQNGKAVGLSVGNQYTGHAFGAGLYAALGSVNLKNMIFKNNTAMGGSSASYAQAGWAFGGGLAIQGPNSGLSTLENITFTNNQALGGSGSDSGGNSLGGGLMVVSAALTANNLTFTNNVARGGNTSGNACGVNPPGGGFGGAISIQYNHEQNFSNITATGNQAYGGNSTGSSSCGGHAIGGSVFMEQSTVHFSDARFQGNSSTGGTGTLNGGIGWGGALYSERVNFSLDRVQVVANTTTSGNSTSGSGRAGAVGGGGAYLAAWDGGNYKVTIVNSLFADNSAVMGPLGLKTNGGGGGAIFLLGTGADITHSTFANNKLLNGISLGQGILVMPAPLAGGGQKVGNATIKYCIFTDHTNSYPWNNSAVEILSSPGNLSYVWFGNNTSDANLPVGTPTDHIWTSLTSAGYTAPSAPNYDYHLLEDSPVIDLAETSTTSVDLDNIARPAGPKPDLGSYEYSVPTLAPEESVLYVMTDTDDIITLVDLISVTIGPSVQWDAVTNAEWIYLGPTGTSTQSSGQTGAGLTIRIDPSKLALGNYVATINLTSSEANPATITVYLYYVDEVSHIFLPVILK